MKENKDNRVVRQSRTERPEGRPANRSRSNQGQVVLTAEERARRRDIVRKRRMMQERNRKKARNRMMIIVTSVILLLFAAIVGAGYGVMYLLQPDPMEEAVLAYEAGTYEEAIAFFEESLEDEESKAEAYIGLALCYWELEDYEQMEYSFEMAYVNGATITGASRNMLASIALQEEDYESALTYIEQGLTCTGNSDELTQEFLRNEIICYEALADWDTAEEKLTSYIAAYPDDEDAIKEAEFLITR